MIPCDGNCGREYEEDELNTRIGQFGWSIDLCDECVIKFDETDDGCGIQIARDLVQRMIDECDKKMQENK
jgi:hypothetical protein